MTNPALPPSPASSSCSRASAASAWGWSRLAWTVWANQWEPSTTTQHAFDCYVRHFGDHEHVCDDIEEVLDEVEAGRADMPDHELLVGGFPCQDYSVAKTLNQARGLQGRKGVLWWQIHRLLEMKRPPFLFLENVDRLLKSPREPARPGLRDHARDPERPGLRRGVAGRQRRGLRLPPEAPPGVHRGPPGGGHAARRRATSCIGASWPGRCRSARPERSAPVLEPLSIDGDPADLSDSFGSRSGPSPFRNAGYCSHRRVWTLDLTPAYDGPRTTLGDILEPRPRCPTTWRSSPRRYPPGGTSRAPRASSASTRRAARHTATWRAASPSPIAPTVRHGRS